MKPDFEGRFQIRELLKPHSQALIAGAFAVAGETIASLLEPWPLKIVLDNVLKSQPFHGWLNQLIPVLAGTGKLNVLMFAAAAVLVIAAFGAVCSYAEKRT